MLPGWDLVGVEGSGRNDDYRAGAAGIFLISNKVNIFSVNAVPHMWVVMGVCIAPIGLGIAFLRYPAEGSTVQKTLKAKIYMSVLRLWSTHSKHLHSMCFYNIGLKEKSQ